ncbi:MAG: hypothetical protein DMG57_34585 [Acidobacteria bacterium]|nr:MAG: hypothetical protein DMG57_34585 [Acidobacteriota bacterium]
MRVIWISAVMLTGGAMVYAQHGHGAGHAAGHVGTPHASAETGHTGGMGHQSASARLVHNPTLSSRLQSLLPGVDLQAAASGFKNLGQFVAAVHVSNNLKIPFDALKAKVTDPNAESLGHAIQDLRPNLDHKTVKSDVKTAERQAKKDLEEAREELDKDDQTVSQKR